MALLPINIEALNSARSRAASALSGFTLGQKIVSVLALLGLVGAAVLFTSYESKPNYQPLFTNLQPADSGAVVAQLNAAKVPYQLTNGGSTILVPASEVDQERVVLAEQGLPSTGTVGFSNLEKSGFTTSQFVQQVEYQQALEGQLAQTIESIQGVQSAQVNLVVPSQSAFAIGNQPPTTASILVNLAPGVTLTSGQVQAIVHLTASATPNLTPSNVTLVDNHGNVLSTPGGSSLGDASTQSQETTAYDNQLASSIEQLLNRVLGVGNSAVQVHAVLNFNQQSTTTTGLQVNAKGQPITANTSQSTTKQTYTGTGAPPSGVIGAGQPPATTNGNYSSTSTSSQVTNAVGQVTQTIKQAPGQVVQTSVAVILNSNTSPKPNQAQITSLITAAAGLNTKAGDQLVVSQLPFAKVSTSKASALASAAARRQLEEHAAEGLGVLLLIGAMLFLALKAARNPIYQEIDVSELTPQASRLLALDQEQATSQSLVPPVAALEGAPDAVIAQVNAQIGKHPVEVARLLRSWAEDES